MFQFVSQDAATTHIRSAHAQRNVTAECVPELKWAIGAASSNRRLNGGRGRPEGASWVQIARDRLTLELSTIVWLPDAAGLRAPSVLHPLLG
jgi:hypothetical protein